MIISVDTGNKHMKTENCEFNSGVEILDTLPGDMEEVIEYEGKYYVTTNRRISYMEDKIADERYFILTLFAIAKELSYREKNEGLLSQNLQEIELLVGLPPAHYGKQRKKFREYFYRNGEVIEFAYKGIPYRIVFKEVKVYIQAYAAYCLLAVKKQLSVVPKVLLIDIGGFTVDYMVLRFGQLEMEYKFYNSVFLSHGLDLSPDTEAATADQILPLVKCELGLAFLPQPMAAPSLLKKEIVQIPLKDEIPERQICLVYDSQHPMGAAARELKNTIVAGRV